MRKKLQFLLLSGLLLVGCSTNQTSSQNKVDQSDQKVTTKDSSTTKSTIAKPKEVNTTCVSEEDGVKLQVKLTAPSSDEEISNSNVSLMVSNEVLGNLAGLKSDELSTLKQFLPTMEDFVKNIFASYLEVSPDEFNLESTDDGIRLTLRVNSVQELKKVLDLDADDSLVFSSLVKELEDESMVCE